VLAPLEHSPHLFLPQYIHHHLQKKTLLPMRWCWLRPTEFSPSFLSWKSIFFLQQVLPSAMVLLQSRDHRTHAWFFLALVIITRTHTTKLHRKTQNKTHPRAHTRTHKERRASACGFPNPNSVVELKGGSRASIFVYFLFSFLFWRNFAKFWPEKSPPTYYTQRIFQWKKWAQIHQVPKKNKIQVAIFFMISFSW